MIMNLLLFSLAVFIVAIVVMTLRRLLFVIIPTLDKKVLCLRCNGENMSSWVRKTGLCTHCNKQIWLSQRDREFIFGKEERESSIECTRCYYENELGSVYCKACGKDLS